MDVKVNYCIKEVAPMALYFRANYGQRQGNGYKSQKKNPFLSMRIMVIFLFFLSLTASGVGFGQKVSLSEKNVSLEKIFKDIKKQTDYVFFYDSRLLAAIKPVSIQVHNEPVKEVLNKILSGLGLEFSIEQKTITIIKNEKWDWMGKNPADYTNKSGEKPTAGTRKVISGTIQDEKGNALEGVSVRLKGTNMGVVSQSNGGFTMEANVGDVLEFSMVGYKKKTFTINSADNLVIIMAIEVGEENEVVVVGYGTQKKINLTGSVVSISNKDTKDRANTSLLTSIQGLVPGVTVISRPGEAPSINFRGRGNLGTSEPLFVINGVIVDKTIFSNLDPNNIESISFLKDAASSSIYGSRAAYGVVLVSTKSGTKGQLNLSYNGFAGVKSPTYLPSMLNSWEYAGLLNEVRGSNGLDPLYSAEEIEKFKNGSDPDHYPNTKWFDLVLDKSTLITQHSLNFSGGSDKIRYFTGLGYLKDDPFMPGQDNKRYNLYTKLSSDVTNWLTLNTDVSYVRTEFDRTQGATSSSRMQYEPSIMVGRQSNGEWGSIAGGARATQTYINYNPLRALSRNDWAHSNSANTIINLGFDLKPFKGLTISGQGSYTSTETKSKSYTALQDNVKDFATGNEIPGTGNSINKMDQVWGNNTSLLYTATAKYNWSNSKHIFSLLGGTSYEQHKYEGLSASRKNFPADMLTDLSAGSNAPEDVTNAGGVSEYRLNSYFGRVNYSFLGRYLFEANIRADGSSRFYKDHRWGVFPSISAGWIMSKESFMKDISWIDLLKLRGSYGTLGNINNVGNYDYFQNYNNSLNYNFDDQAVSGISESQPSNITLGWEQIAMTDFGLDLDLLGQKLSLSVDYYIKNTNDILLAYNVPIEVGVSANPSQNIGKLQNKGLELSLNYKGDMNDFKYSIGGNIAFNKNEITDLGGSDNMIYNGGDLIRYIYKVGDAVGSYYGYKTDGLYTQAEIDKGEYYVLGRIPNAGDVKYVPQRPDIAWGAAITGEDRTIIGNDVPKFNYGLNIQLQYKNFDISAFGQGISGTEVAFESEAYEAFSEGGNARSFHMQSWTQTDPNPHAIYPRIYGSALDNYNISNFSDYHLFDADYFRVKTVSMGYNIPKSFLSKHKIASARVFVNLENMFTIRADKKMKDFDPETASSRSLGIGTKTVSVGINLNL